MPCLIDSKLQAMTIPSNASCECSGYNTPNGNTVYTKKVSILYVYPSPWSLFFTLIPDHGLYSLLWSQSMVSVLYFDPSPWLQFFILIPVHGLCSLLWFQSIVSVLYFDPSPWSLFFILIPVYVLYSLCSLLLSPWLQFFTLIPDPGLRSLMKSLSLLLS